jgi:hypothetical protein
MFRRMPVGAPVHHRIRALVVSLCAAASMVACAMSPARLPDLDRRFYYNLSSPAEQSEFLEIEEQQRKAYLQKKGLWQQWVALPPAEREAAKGGLVELGFHEFAMFMAWGPPADTQRHDREGKPATIHTYIRCSSGPKRGEYVLNNLDCNGTSDETQVLVQDDLIVEVRYPN